MLPNPGLINRTRIQIQNEQIYNLYRRLYWYIAQDFLHKEDYAVDVTMYLAEIDAAISTHVHPLNLATETTLPAGPLKSPIVPNPESIELMPAGMIPVMAATKIMFGGGFDEHAAGLIAGGHIVGNITNPSPVYAFTVRQPSLIPDPAGTAAADIAIGGQIVTGEAGQPFTMDAIATVLETALG